MVEVYRDAIERKSTASGSGPEREEQAAAC
jgi:hypothetical protein